jgi:hypothetical protein
MKSKFSKKSSINSKETKSLTKETLSNYGSMKLLKPSKDMITQELPSKCYKELLEIDKENFSETVKLPKWMNIRRKNSSQDSLLYSITQE